MTGWRPRVEPCPPEAREAALQVLYQRIPDSLRSRLVVEVLQEASRGQVDLSGLWVAWDRCLGLGTARFRIIGTLLTQALAGRAAAVWAPEVLPSWRRATTAAALVRSALADLQARGFRIVQAVLVIGQPPRRDRPDPRRDAPGHGATLSRARHSPTLTGIGEP